MMIHGNVLNQMVFHPSRDQDWEVTMVISLSGSITDFSLTVSVKNYLGTHSRHSL